MKKKILFTSPNLFAGGAQRHLINIVNSLDETIFDIILLLYSGEGELLNEVNSNVRIITSSQNYISKRFFPIRVLLGIICTIRTIRTTKPDIIYSRHWCKIPNAILGNFFNIKTVSGEGNNLKETLFKKSLKIRIFYFLRWIGLRYSSSVVANSISLGEEIKNVFAPDSGVEVIYNGVDIKNIRLQASMNADHPWFDKKYPLLISIGRLSEQKDHRTFIEALKMVNDKTYVRAIIIGEGKLRENLIEL